MKSYKHGKSDAIFECSCGRKTLVQLIAIVQLSAKNKYILEFTELKRRKKTKK